MSDKKANAKLEEKLAAMALMDRAVADTPPVTAGATAAPPFPTAPPARAERPAKKAASAVKAPAAATPITSTVSLYGPAADALRRLQMALMTAAGRSVSASAAVSVALEYAAGQLPGGTDQLAELLAGVALHDKRRRQP